MITWKDRIEQVKATFAIKNNKQLEEQLGLGNGYVNDLIGGSKNKNPKRIIEALVERYKISPVWFFDESVGMFGDKQENAVKQESDLILAIRKTENNNEDRFSEIENRLTAIETLLKESQHERMQAVSSNKDDPLHTAENEPAYGDEEGAEEEYEEIPYVHDIAAGPPIPQSNDLGDIVAVPRHLMKKGKHYYAASIRGSSMTEAGIHDGDMVLIRCEDVPRDSAIQVVQYDGRSTLKLLKKSENNGWELHYRDGTGRVITCASSDYKTQGEFEAVLPKVIVLGK